MKVFGCQNCINKNFLAGKTQPGLTHTRSTLAIWRETALPLSRKWHLSTASLMVNQQCARALSSHLRLAITRSPPIHHPNSLFRTHITIAVALNFDVRRQITASSTTWHGWRSRGSWPISEWLFATRDCRDSELRTCCITSSFSSASLPIKPAVFIQWYSAPQYLPSSASASLLCSWGWMRCWSW